MEPFGWPQDAAGVLPHVDHFPGEFLQADPVGALDVSNVDAQLASNAAFLLAASPKQAAAAKKRPLPAPFASQPATALKFSATEAPPPWRTVLSSEGLGVLQAAEASNFASPWGPPPTFEAAALACPPWSAACPPLTAEGSTLASPWSMPGSASIAEGSNMPPLWSTPCPQLTAAERLERLVASAQIESTMIGGMPSALPSDVICGPPTAELPLWRAADLPQIAEEYQWPLDPLPTPGSMVNANVASSSLTESVPWAPPLGAAAPIIPIVTNMPEEDDSRVFRPAPWRQPIEMTAASVVPDQLETIEFADSLPESLPHPPMEVQADSSEEPDDAVLDISMPPQRHGDHHFAPLDGADSLPDAQLADDAPLFCDLDSAAREAEGEIGYKATVVLDDLYHLKLVDLEQYPEFYDDMVEDITAEARRCGTIAGTWADRSGQTASAWVTFEVASEAEAFQGKMNHRWFAGRKVTATLDLDSVWNDF